MGTGPNESFIRAESFWELVSRTAHTFLSSAVIPPDVSAAMWQQCLYPVQPKGNGVHRSRYFCISLLSFADLFKL